VAAALFIEPGRRRHRRLSLVHPRRTKSALSARIPVEYRRHGLLSVVGYPPLSKNGKVICGPDLTSNEAMPHTIISVEDLSKKYLVGHESARRERYTALRDVIAREARNFARNAADVLHGRQIVQGDEIEEFWALRDISFEVKQGEILGIIGSNGAGKSTLLKILSRVTEPSRGRVRLRGRVASLLEVGTGFHPELTGRENIFLNGAILGMTRAEIRSKFDEIAVFADVEKFLDTPIKRYSSGMYVRLAFAVAAHLEPDILVVDEVLAVGDAAFQKKCIGKMDEVSRREGRTVLLVSHNMAVITSLCPNAIWLDKGSIRYRGEARKVISEYLVQRVRNQEQVLSLKSFAHRHDAEERLRLEALEWLCDLPLRHGDPVKARIHFKTRVPIEDVVIGIAFSTVDGRRLLTYDSDFPAGYRHHFDRPGDHSVDIDIDSLPLAPDIYTLDIGSRSGDFGHLDYIPGAALLDILPGSSTPASIIRKDAGVRLESRWTWTRDDIGAAGSRTKTLVDQSVPQSR
jgi:lipopolysaccharide transport system ATP-binding protein